MLEKSIQEENFIRWLPVENYEGLYEVSELGQVRSLDRTLIGSDGVHYPFKGRMLSCKPHINLQYPLVSLWKNNKGTTHYVHRLVCNAFYLKDPLRTEVNHKDGNRLNNHYLNLEWCTSQENKIHAVNTGLRKYTNKLSKEEFVSCLYEVINGISYAQLTNFVPYKVPYLSVKLRKIAEELGLVGELDESLMIQRINRARINGAKNTKR